MAARHERRFLLRASPDPAGAPALQVNVAYLGTQDGWSVRVAREFRLAPDGTPGAERCSLLVRRPDGRTQDGPLAAELGAALFAAAPWKVFYTDHALDAAWRLRVFRLRHEGLVLGVGPADAPVPAWCGAEVTDDDAYAEERLAGVPRVR
ncbi:hypothetical protein EV189_2241 [Motilibacter rhizosphaerae]|uniref:CYTH domain-containing protein n=1 Tax=Motilibacter rhizosphaerae TaxID=598652 RepID=A0A4Q7NNM0_9ACTN|nr:hypothetical protein [Motilibacter rhizosphaerae]RZS86825.1 hypothetical protein EV189_2241 [Motilibacter rhizosphaerae]